MNKSKANENLNNEEIASVVVDVATGAITDSFRYGDSYKKQTREDRKKILEFLAKEDECFEFNKGVSFVKEGWWESVRITPFNEFMTLIYHSIILFSK